VTIKAVVFDIGGVLEIIDDSILMKPDPRVFVLTAQRLGVRPDEVLFLDDLPGDVEAAHAAGWHAVLHTSTPDSIAAMERILTTE